MSRLALILVAGAVATALVAAVGVLGYRARKIAILEPRPLDAELAWSGDKDAPCTLLMIGDSHVARWPVQSPPHWRVARLGFPGEAAVNIAAALPQVLQSTKPDVLLVAAGTNDASAAALQASGRDPTLERAAGAVDRMMVSAREAGVERVVVLTLAPPRFPELWRRLVYGERQASAMTELSQRIETRARIAGAAILDAAALARDSQGRVRPELRADALHWSPAGYRVLDAALWDQVQGSCG